MGVGDHQMSFQLMSVISVIVSQSMLYPNGIIQRDQLFHPGYPSPPTSQQKRGRFSFIYIYIYIVGKYSPPPQRPQTCNTTIICMAH